MSIQLQPPHFCEGVLLEGDLRLVMNGFDGITVPKQQYEYQVEQILERGGPEADLIRTAMKHRERSLTAFERQMQIKDCLFRHIMPVGALNSYKATGFYCPDAWARLLRGKRATNTQIAKHIRNTISLLEKYDNYQLGLPLIRKRSATPQV